MLKKITAICILFTLMFSGIGCLDLAIFNNTETINPDAYNYWGTVRDSHLMDGASGYGDFVANSEGEVYFDNWNDPFTKANFADGYISFKLEYADVTNNDHGAYIYLDVYPDGQSDFYLTYLFYCVDFDGAVHWKTISTSNRLSYFDTNNDGIINHGVLRHKANDPNTVRIYQLQYSITFDEPPATETPTPPLPPDPCEGITCPDRCIGEYWGTDGYCVDGTCRYTKVKIDGKCGYSAPPDVNIPPIVQVDKEEVGYIYSYDASASTDPDGTITSYTWTVDDLAAGTGQTFELDGSTFSAGTHTVKLAITDNDGATSTYTHRITVTVKDEAVVIESGEESTIEGEEEELPTIPPEAVFVMNVGGQPFYIPGFSAIFAIAGLLAVTYIVLRERRT